MYPFVYAATRVCMRVFAQRIRETYTCSIKQVQEEFGNVEAEL